MPVTPQESDKYRAFVQSTANEIGVFNFEPEQIVWHYTNGEGFLGIVESGSIYATQVASLNDRNETKYATGLFRMSLERLIEEKKDDEPARTFLYKVLEFLKEDPIKPPHGTSKFFVTCFSTVEDDLPQWTRYGGKNGYAIGFIARGLTRGPNSKLYKVVYDKARQEKASKDLADATLAFYLEGLTGDRLQDPGKWAEEFFAAWDEWIYKLAPLAKDSVWSSENEFRLVHELDISELGKVRFRQRETTLARYIALTTPSWVKRRFPLLPIAKVLIGPQNHPAFTRVSVSLLLEQMGYPPVPIEVSKIPLQTP